MTFEWPRMLWLVALLPVLVLLSLWLLRRRRPSTVRLASIAIAREALGKGPGWRRHVPPALMLLALAVLMLAMARPIAVISLPLAQRTIMLAMDVSGSMRATDVQRYTQGRGVCGGVSMTRALTTCRYEHKA